MFKKRNFFIIAICFLYTQSYAQKLMHAFGTNISVMDGRIVNNSPGVYSSSSFTLTQTNLSYFPRYNFIENENSSVSVGIPLGIGIGLFNNSYGGDGGVSFAYDLPAVIDYNIGCKSTSENENNFGGYFGVGFGYYKVSLSHSSYSDFNGSTYGPLVRAGVRFSSANESWNGHAITVGMFFKKGLETYKFKTYGFNVLIDL